LPTFRIGNLNLIVATAVAEEGLDIQACCNVVRWDVAAEHGQLGARAAGARARQRSSFVPHAFENSLEFLRARTVRKWEEQEERDE